MITPLDLLYMLNGVFKCIAMDFDPTSAAYAYDDTGYDMEDEDDEEYEEITEDDCWAVISGFFAQKEIYHACALEDTFMAKYCSMIAHGSA